MQDNSRVFFILFENGETSYFNVSRDGISYNGITGYSLGIYNNMFSLNDYDGNALFCLDVYLDNEVRAMISQIFIDEDVFRGMYESGKLVLDDDSLSKVYGIDTSQMHPEKKSKRQVRVK